MANSQASGISGACFLGVHRAVDKQWLEQACMRGMAQEQKLTRSFSGTATYCCQVPSPVVREGQGTATTLSPFLYSPEVPGPFSSTTPTPWAS